MTNATPSIDPTDLDSLTGLLRHVFKKLMQGIDGMLPAKVIAYDRATNRAQIQPAVVIVSTTGQRLPRAQIASVPVLQIGGGGHILRFNLKTGDKGWILANDRDISLFLQSYAQAEPNTFRIKNFADGLFIPDVMHGYTIAGEDAENAVLQSVDGSVRLALWPNKIKITAPEGLEVDGPLKVSGALIANGGISATGGGANSFVVTGNQRTIGNIEATGDITPHVPPED
jgi:hypothetical protein